VQSEPRFAGAFLAVCRRYTLNHVAYPVSASGLKHDGFLGHRAQGWPTGEAAAQATTDRPFPIVEALARLRSRSCIRDGEAVACDDNGLAVFDQIWYRRHDGKVFLYVRANFFCNLTRRVRA
jgi:hypothetical protein